VFSAFLFNNLKFTIMPPRTTFATSGNRGGRQSASTSSGGAIGRGGRFISRNQRYRDVRASLGMATG